MLISEETEIRAHQNLTSLLYLPNPFIVPGGRFREVYYWDSYWIIRGLLHCGMKDTARGMIDNMFYLLEHLSYVPNGGRIYYTRSQPPLLALMVDTYVEMTGDTAWALTKLDLLVQEWNYWLEHHSVQFEGHKMFRYYSQEATPRPESYREDMNLVSHLQDTGHKERVWRELRSAAESGWDFSSRYLVYWHIW